MGLSPEQKKAAIHRVSSFSCAPPSTLTATHKPFVAGRLTCRIIQVCPIKEVAPAAAIMFCTPNQLSLGLCAAHKWRCNVVESCFYQPVSYIFVGVASRRQAPAVFILFHFWVEQCHFFWGGIKISLVDLGFGSNPGWQPPAKSQSREPRFLLVRSIF